MLLIKKNNFEIQTPIRLVKADEVASVLNAQELISAAEAEAAQIREAAKAAYEEERQRGYEKGLEDGKAAIVARKLELLDESVTFMESVEDKMVGVVMKALQKCVMEIGEKEMVVQIVRKVMNAVVRTQRHITLKVAPDMVSVVKERLDEIMKDYPLLDESVAFMESVEGRMVDVVMKALKKCIMEIGDRELVVQIVRKVMNAVVRNQRHITLKVEPDMVPVVRERLDEILKEYPLLDEIDVQEDSRLKGAACMIETEAGIADASVETQLAAIENSLRKHFSKEG